MIVYMNFVEHRGPFGGANSFLRTLRDGMTASGWTVTNDPAASFDVALVNALSQDIDLAFVERLARRGAPIVHRKVGYRVSGSAEMRSRVDGVVHGDAIQVAFGPYLAHTVFQSEYSRDVFLASGFTGEFTVIHNGVDERLFHPHRAGLLGRRPRRPWDGSEPLRIVISTWSTDENKGFPEYAAIDRELTGRRDVRLELVGRVPVGTTFGTIRARGPKRARALARILRDSHVLLQLARFETCSNALIEGLNCGLPAIYLDSGSNRELAGEYGVPFEGDLDAAIAALAPLYADIAARLPSNPFRASIVVPRYLSLLRDVVAAVGGPTP